MLGFLVYMSDSFISLLSTSFNVLPSVVLQASRALMDVPVTKHAASAGLRVSIGTVLFDTNTSVCYSMLSDGGVLLCPESVEQEARVDIIIS